jgi:transcription initiation factor TFIIH subunit 4
MVSLDNTTLIEDEAMLIDEGNQSSSGQARDATNSEKFIIVETNFKVYAYTRSKVYLALLKHLMKVEYAFPDLVVANLTRKALQPAFERGITSKQIIDFLESHAHVNARLNKLAM